MLRSTLLLITLATLSFGATPNISGEWTFSVDLESGGHGDPIFILKHDGDRLSGSYSGPLGEQKVSGTLSGDKAVFGFKASQDGQTVQATYTGTVESATRMSGTIQIKNESGDEVAAGKWTASRK